jgi:apolipoprotein N-acyltransferase
MSAVTGTLPEQLRSSAAEPKWAVAQTAAGYVALAVASFYVAYLGPWCAWVIGLYLFAMVRLCHHGTARTAVYAGFAVGLLVGAGQLTFFWRIFSAAAIVLWCVYAFWLGLFTGIGRLVTLRFGNKAALVVLPLLWCGLEYFRSELYYLRFSWLSPALAFGLDPTYAPIGLLGTYGTGFVLSAIASCATWHWQASRVKALAVLAGGIAVFSLVGWSSRRGNPADGIRQLPVAGVQLEFASEKEVLVWLNHLNQSHPDARLLVLSEYTFDDVPSDAIKGWCREHHRYLIVGGKQPAGSNNFYNTAFVISPQGQTVFQQAKSVPIQFFKDGLAAPEQKLWDSPWGKLGICICYDLSYTRVTDRLVQMGAEALIVPTMDVADWGKRQHELHARVGPVRAAEYHVPVFRLASSGISQAISSSGTLLASTPFPGQGAMLSASLALGGSGRVPYDRWLALVCVAGTSVLIPALFVLRRRTAPSETPAC